LEEYYFNQHLHAPITSPRQASEGGPRESFLFQLLGKAERAEKQHVTKMSELSQSPPSFEKQWPLGGSRNGGGMRPKSRAGIQSFFPQFWTSGTAACRTSRNNYPQGKGFPAEAPVSPDYISRRGFGLRGGRGWRNGQPALLRRGAAGVGPSNHRPKLPRRKGRSRKYTEEKNSRDSNVRTSRVKNP